jgi:hypothetical protein
VHTQHPLELTDMLNGFDISTDNGYQARCPCTHRKTGTEREREGGRECVYGTTERELCTSTPVHRERHNHEGKRAPHADA